MEDIVFDPKHKSILENRLNLSLLSVQLLRGYNLYNNIYVVENDSKFIPTYQKNVQPTLEKILEMALIDQYPELIKFIFLKN